MIPFLDEILAVAGLILWIGFACVILAALWFGFTCAIKIIKKLKKRWWLK